MNVKETTKKLKEIQKEIDLQLAEQQLQSIKGTATRSRSITVGTAFNGVTEVCMRGDGNSVLWCLMQPVEVVELIHQLAANIGCHIHLQSRNDFASWRKWKEETELGFNSRNEALHPPLISAATNPDFKTALLSRSKDDEQTVAIEKPKNRRSAKRAAKAA